MRKCEKKTKDMAKEKEQSAEMQLMVDITERNWIDSHPGTIHTNVESQLNMGYISVLTTFFCSCHSGILFQNYCGVCLYLGTLWL